MNQYDITIQREVQNYVNFFIKQDINYFNTVQQIFQKHPKKTSEDNITIKTAVLNQLYRKHIFDIDSMI